MERESWNKRLEMLHTWGCPVPSRGLCFFACKIRKLDYSKSKLSKLVCESQWPIHMEYLNSLQTFLRLTKSLRTLQFFNSPSQACSLLTFLSLFQPFSLASYFTIPSSLGDRERRSEQ